MPSHEKKKSVVTINQMNHDLEEVKMAPTTECYQAPTERAWLVSGTKKVYLQMGWVLTWR